MQTPYIALRVHDEQDLREEISRKFDSFLDVYSLYLHLKSDWILEEVRLKAYELRLLDPRFTFQI
ncbi:MAG: hypothetical protein A2Z83_07365 [Omnitrophica bacterium GWA2_52_8]|nr:MAG: hypothetical protein A2Z83_07365 [Omnitrophica bacterium GWA2_52_8]